jgi:hypothetical protein
MKKPKKMPPNDMPFSEDINNQETASFRPSAIFLLQ